MASVALLLVVGAVLFSRLTPTSAASLEATWSLFERADALSFVPGTTATSAGYEIVSFAAVGPSAGLSTYQYGGADLVPPQPPIVTCSATVEPTDLALLVDNAYPYAGCVFFVGVENTGTSQADPREPWKPGQLRRSVLRRRWLPGI